MLNIFFRINKKNGPSTEGYVMPAERYLSEQTVKLVVIYMLEKKQKHRKHNTPP